MTVVADHEDLPPDRPALRTLRRFMGHKLGVAGAVIILVVTVVAILALTLAAGATVREAAILANHAAGIVVGKFGPATVTADELLAQF